MTKQPNNIQEIFVPTPLQQGMLFHNIKAPGSSVYVQQYSLKGNGSMDADLCATAWAAVVARHPSLRTSFHWEGLEKSYQVVHSRVSLPFVHEDISHLDTPAQQEYLAELLAKDSRAGFDLTKAPLFRVQLHRLSCQQFQMTLTFHHIIADGWSIGLAIGEFVTAFGRAMQGKPATLPPAPSMQAYAEKISSRPQAEARQWWAGKLQNAEATLPLRELMLDQGSQSADSFAQLERLLAPEASKMLEANVRKMGITLNSLFSGAWALVLARHSGKRKILTGITATSRPPDVPDVENIFGLMLNILPLHLECPAHEPVRTWLHNIQNYLADAYSYDFLPLSSLRAVSDIPPGASFLESLAVFENFPMADADTSPFGFTFTEVASFEKTSYPLTIVGFPGERLRLVLQYDKFRFSLAAVETLLDTMRDALLFLAEHPDAPLRDFFAATATGSSNKAVSNGPPRNYPLLNPWQALTDLARAKGGQTALICVSQDAEETLTYSELAGLAQEIAQRLKAENIKPGDIVGIRLPTGPAQLAAMFAVWQAGALWTPLPAAYPAAQVADMLTKTTAAFVVSVPELWEPVADLLPGVTNNAPDTIGNATGAADNTPDGAKSTPSVIFISANRPSAPQQDYLPPPDLTPDSPACLLHTSGSTGVRKEVLLPHKALSNRLHWMWEAFPWQAGERACQKTSPAFVDFIWETFGAVLHGIPLVMLKEAEARDPQQLVNILEKYAVTRLVVVPSLLSAIHLSCASLQNRLPKLKLLTCSGETLSEALVQETQRTLPQARLLNLYGSTEVTGDATWYEVPRAHSGPVPIGHPIANSKLVILDENHLPVMPPETDLIPGKTGELYISGECLAAGYHHALQAGSSAFIPSSELPFSLSGNINGNENANENSGADATDPLWFATGDMARQDSEGLFYLKGRKDGQCKIRGVRVNPEEIREALLTHDKILEAVVLPQLYQGQNRIVAYVRSSVTILASSSTSADDPADYISSEQKLSGEIKSFLKARLPEAMCPSQIVFIEEWSRTPSGKIDLRALPTVFSAAGTVTPGDNSASASKVTSKTDEEVDNKSETGGTVAGPEKTFINPDEIKLAQVWEGTLGKTISRRDANFFDLGGDSISITQMAFNLRKAFACDVSIQSLYRYPRLQDMAEYIVSEKQNLYRLPDAHQAEKDIYLADDLIVTKSTALPQGITGGQRVFVTGASGFIALWITAKLLQRGDLKVTCLEAAPTPEKGLEQIKRKLRELDCWDEAFLERLQCLPGVMEKKNFGLSLEQWNKLQEETDCIVHSGFNINLAQSYAALRPVNVEGARETLRLASEGKSIPLHYIGSTSIVDYVALAGREEPVLENEEFASCAGIQTGYILSRWVADHMMRRAQQRGLPVAVYRMTTVSGDSAHCRFDLTEMYWRLIRAFVQTNMMPQSKRMLDLVPVDMAAQAVLALASGSQSYGQAFHINSPHKLPWETLHKYLAAEGYPIKLVSAKEWAQQMRSLPPDKIDDNMRILLSMLNDDGYDANTSLTLSCEKTTQALLRNGVQFTPMTRELFSAHLQYMIDTGWISPKSRGESL